MKIKFLLLSLSIIFNITSCSGQDKKDAKLPSEKVVESSITDNFSKSENLYFDPEQKQIFSTSLNENLGKFTVYYLPISKEDINYYENFEDQNNIIPLFDEANSISYFSITDSKKINEILKVKTKSENNFKLVGTYVPKKYITVENRDEYNIDFPYSQKYYKKENGKWIYLFEKKITKPEDDSTYNSKNYINSLASNKKDIKNSTIHYQIDGRWMVNCENGVGSLTIEGKDASLILLYNQIYIDMTELKRFDFENGISYKLKEIPEDIGNIGRNLNWKEYINDEPIAYIKMIDDKTYHFYWYGFYNKKTKKREFKENSFQQETNNEEVILKKCE
ncbi:hypothetical protein ACLB9Y_13155 [Chryseobacterium scophthalmum]|uniref:hypothetical protein n=1 Tax=Chryseobacterium scophthalmum TaxID=59733 RepID=UPI00398A6532